MNLTKLALVALAVVIAIAHTGCSSLDDALEAKGSGPSKVYEERYDTVWSAVLESVESVGLDLVSQNKEQGTILALGKAGFFSSGENVAVFIETQGTAGTVVEIVNKRAIATDLTARDWGATVFADLDRRLVARPDSQTPQATPMPKRGTRWRYTYQNQPFRSGTHAFTIEIVSVNGAKVEERMLTEGGEVSEQVVDGEQLRFVSRTIAGTDTLLELAPYAPALYNRKAVAPDGYPAPHGDFWKIGRVNFAAERIAVPAGRFATLRVSMEGTSARRAGGAGVILPTRFSYTAWYSEKMRRYVKIQHQTWNAYGNFLGNEIVQLVAYEPAE